MTKEQVAAYFASNLSELGGQAKAWLAQGAKDLHNQIVPAFPSYAHGVDEPGTPLNMPTEAENPQGVLYDSAAPPKPSFEQSIAGQAPPSLKLDKPADPGMEL